MKRWKITFLILGLSLSIWGRGQDSNASGPSDPGKPQAEQVVSSKEAKELFRSVDEILKFASDDTALPVKHEVKRRLAKRDEVQHYIEKSLKEDKDAKRLERSAAVLKKFGLIPKDFDLTGFIVAMLREQVAGYYDVKTKSVNLLNWVDVESQKPVLAHELTHALQDQSFGIEKWMKEAQPDKKSAPSPADILTDEESSARQAVLEGQAMVVLFDYTLAPQGMTAADAPQVVAALKKGMVDGTTDSPKFQQAPMFLKEELTFPYRFGLDFTLALLKAGGKQLAYAGALTDPPKTTREVMEPQTYITHEKLSPLKMIDMDADFKGYEAFDIGAMGEFDVDILVEQYAGRERAEAVYPGWRGGYYYAGKPKANSAAPLGVLYVSRWASAEKAAEFAAIYAQSLAQRYQRHQALDDAGKPVEDAVPVASWRTLRGRHVWSTEDGTVVIDVRGDEILISESMDEQATSRAAADFWGEPGK